jgi:S1-C subfamily serine protease
MTKTTYRCEDEACPCAGSDVPLDPRVNLEVENLMATDPAIYERRHVELMLPVVRVRTGRGSGSGTVIYSAPDDDGLYSTFILTNHHVVSSLIKIEQKWSTLLKREIKTDVLGIPEIDHFNYRWQSRAIGAANVETDIVAYDKGEDLALLRSRSEVEPPAVAQLLPRGDEERLRVTMPTYAIGAALGAPPVITQGMLSTFGVEIEGREFWLQTSATIFGNSGGALFLADTHEWIGVPALIGVSMSGFSAQAIEHMSYAIPITRVYQFLEDQRFRFIYDDEFTEEGEAEERKRLRDREERRMAAESDGEEG